MIEAVKVNKTYNKGKVNAFKALTDIDLTIEDGEFIGIVGPSGSGKSTLLHLLAAIDVFDDGEIVIDGKKLSKMNDKKLAQLRNEKFGLIVQDYALIDEFTVYENILVPLLFSKRKIDQTKVRNILDKIDITELKEKLISQLSGGQKQRVAICRALVNEPSILFADEPTGSLDSECTNEVFSILRGLNNNGITIIMVTHNESIANSCDRIIEIKDGKILNNKLDATLPDIRETIDVVS